VVLSAKRVTNWSCLNISTLKSPIEKGRGFLSKASESFCDDAELFPESFLQEKIPAINNVHVIIITACNFFW
jgi:hypothetical protein